MEQNEKDTICKWHQAEINDLKKTVYGNGIDGLKVTVAVIRQRVNLLLWIDGIVGIAVIGAIVAGLASLMKSAG